MLKTLAIALAMISLAALVNAAIRPNCFHVERSTNIKAPPEKIFALINDFRLWNGWTPYNRDPAMKKTFSGKPGGKGAAYAWEGNKAVGKGKIAITELTPPSRIAFDLQLVKPFEAHNHVVIALDARGDTTTVTWIMEGTQAFFAKLVGLFVSTDKMIGRDFETGLANLKALAEK